MGLPSQSDGLPGSVTERRRRPEGRDFLLVMDSLERRLEDLRTSGGPLGRGGCKAAADAAAAAVARRCEAPQDSALHTSRVVVKEHRPIPDENTQSTLRRPQDDGKPNDKYRGPADFFQSRLCQLRALNLEEELCHSQGDSICDEHLQLACAESALAACMGSLAYSKADSLAALNLQRRASCPGNLEITKDNAAFAGASMPADMTAEIQRAELQSQLSTAEYEVARLVRSMANMRGDHDSQITAIRAECSAQARRHAVDRGKLQSEASSALSEVSRLQQALAGERRRSAELMERSAAETRRNFVPSTPQAVAPIIASLEVEALRRVDQEQRSKLKKKLQLKWHPDKCINAALAKCVMQELQQRPEW